MSKYPEVFERITFAWDSRRQDKYVVKAIDLLRKYKIKTKQNHLFYCLYGFNDKPEEVFERWKLLLNNKIKIKPMRFRDIETGTYGNFWNGFDKEVSNFISKIFITGIITYDPNSKRYFDFDYKTFRQIVRATNLYCKKYNKQSLKKYDFENVVKIAKMLEFDNTSK